MADRASALKGAIQNRVRAHQDELRRAAAAGLYFAMGLAMGAAELFASCGPFGIAAVAAVGTEPSGILCLLGTAIGYLLCGGLETGVRYIATMFLVFTMDFALSGVGFARRDWFRPACAMLFTAVTGLLYSVQDVAAVPGLLRLLAEVTLAGGCTYFFRQALETGPTATESAEFRRGISTVILGACALMGLARLSLWDVLSIGRFLSVLVVMALAYGGGTLTGCAAGAAFGLAMDMARGTSLFFCGAYAVSALIAGAIAKRGKLAFTVAFCACDAMAVLVAWSDGGHIPALYECFGAAVTLMLLPGTVLAPVAALLKAPSGQGEAAFRLYQAARLEKVSDAFGEMYKAVRAAADTESGEADASTVFDRASDAVCRDCARKEQCWDEDFAQTLAAMKQVSDKMLLKGALSAADLPPSFREQCAEPGLFTAAVNGELRGVMYRKQYLARLTESRTAAYGQFADVSEVVRAAARELSGQAGPDQAAERRLSRYLRAQQIDAVCSVFRDVRGRLRAVIESRSAETFADQEGTLEKLSKVLGVRLCRLPSQESARLMLVQAEPLAVSVGIAAMKKEGEQVSGDRGTYFKTDAGVLCVVLSDGMGTGAKAASESASAVRILEGFLRAGVDPASAMRLLNSVALLKNGDEWGYATVDLCCIDLFTGDTCFYKYGAAPSYIKAGRSIRRVRCSSVMAGMLAGENAGPDVIRMKLRPGNIALIASDGVLAEKNDQWLRGILDGVDNVEAKEIARLALRAASEKFGGADDMTALVIRVEERP